MRTWALIGCEIRRASRFKRDCKAGVRRGCHVRSDWPLAYELADDAVVLKLVRTGTPSDLFDEQVCSIRHDKYGLIL